MDHQKINLLRKGKTNWKFILIILILAVIVGGGILGWQYIQNILKAPLIIKDSIVALKDINSYILREGYESSSESNSSLMIVNIPKKESYFKEEVNDKTTQEYYDVGGIFYYKKEKWEKAKSTTDYSNLANLPSKYLATLETCIMKPHIIGKEIIEGENHWIIFFEFNLKKCKNNIQIQLPENALMNAKIWVGEKDKFLRKYEGYIYNKETKEKIGRQWAEFSDYNKSIEVPPLPEELNSLIETNKTANWKTYKNEEYGFELKYPPEYALKEDVKKYITEFGEEGDYIAEILLNKIIIDSPCYKSTIQKVYTGINETDNTFTACSKEKVFAPTPSEEYIKKISLQLTEEGWPMSKEVNGVIFYRRHFVSHAMGGKAYPDYAYQGFYENKCYKIGIEGYSQSSFGFVDECPPSLRDSPQYKSLYEEEDKKIQEIFFLIFSTFRFLE